MLVIFFIVYIFFIDILLFFFYIMLIVKGKKIKEIDQVFFYNANLAIEDESSQANDVLNNFTSNYFLSALSDQNLISNQINKISNTVKSKEPKIVKPKKASKPAKPKIIYNNSNNSSASAKLELKPKKEKKLNVDSQNDDYHEEEIFNEKATYNKSKIIHKADKSRSVNDDDVKSFLKSIDW